MGVFGLLTGFDRGVWVGSWWVGSWWVDGGVLAVGGAQRGVAWGGGVWGGGVWGGSFALSGFYFYICGLIILVFIMVIGL